MNELKLTCPICEEGFKTKHPSSIYCSVICREKNYRIRNQIEKNKNKQQPFLNKKFTYNIDEDKFYITSIMLKNDIKNKMNEEAKKELEKIEYKNRTWRSEFSKQMSIWEEIAERINSCKGKEKKHWGLVMSLHNQKYKQTNKL